MEGMEKLKEIPRAAVSVPQSALESAVAVVASESTHCGGDGCGEHLPYCIVFKLRSSSRQTGLLWSLSLVVAALHTT